MLQKSRVAPCAKRNVLPSRGVKVYNRDMKIFTTKIKATVPILFYIALFAIALIAIIVGSIKDIDISHKLVSITNPLGMFVETFGIILGYSMVTIGSVTFFAGAFFREERWWKILGALVLTVGVSLAVFFLTEQLGRFHADEVYYGYRNSNKIAFIIAAVSQVVVGIITFFIVDKAKSEACIRVGLIIVLAMATQVLLLYFLKKIGCRPRYRFLIDPELNTAGYEFVNWWQFGIGKRPSGEYFKSWPSGHTATAACVILIGYLPNVLRWRFRFDKYVLFIVGALYTIFVAFARILIGAHFLTDVAWGALIGTLCCFLWSFFIERLFLPKEEEAPEKKEEAK